MYLMDPDSGVYNDAVNIVGFQMVTINLNNTICIIKANNKSIKIHTLNNDEFAILQICFL